MAQRRVFIDKTEIVFMVPVKSKVARYELSAKEIVRIQFDKCTERVFGVFPKQSEMITIVSGKLGSPIVYKRGANQKFFDEYKRGLEKFAKDNFVTFTDNITE